MTHYVILLSSLFGQAPAIEPARPVIERLDPPRRAAVVMALLALVLTGLLLVACAMLGAHWVRRMARHRPGNGRTSVAVNRLSNLQMRDALQEILPTFKSADTLLIDPSTKETKADG